MSVEEHFNQLTTRVGPDGTVTVTRSIGINRGFSLAEIRPKPKPDTVGYPEGVIDSLRPILREVFDPLNNQEDGPWLDLLSAQTMSYGDALAKLKGLHKSATQVAEALLTEDPQLQENIGWHRMGVEGQKALVSRVATRLKEEYENSTS
jgi:hypothetical protein